MKVEFPIPQGFTLPDGVKEGETFEFMAEGYIEGDMLYVSSVEGNPVGEKKEEAPMDEMASNENPQAQEGDFVDSIETGMS
jgi:hypothetical protein